MTASPLVSLQSPKDISIDDIEAELHQIWQSYNNSEDGFAASRATTFTLVVYEPEPTQHLLAVLGFYTGPVDGIGGPRTTAAIKAAQKAYGLKSTGLSSPELVAQLFKAIEQAQQEGKLTNAQETAVAAVSPDSEGSGIADAIAATNPCRIIAICPTTEVQEGVQVQVSAYCPINKRNQNSLICCEYITLKGSATSLEQIGGVVEALLIADLPKFVWWKASLDMEYALLKRLGNECDRIIIDSSTFNQPESDLLHVCELVEKGINIVDINWARLAAWQELTAQAFDPPDRRAAVGEIDKVTIDYEKGNPAQALLYLGWVASRLKWRPVGYEIEGGDYDICRVKFNTEDQKPVEAELGGIPLADWGQVLGDLISLRLTSSNLDADCCTVLCSQATGCMRMESGGGAQSCRIQQVTPLSDQGSENILGQQLQRWGKDVLYLESLAVVYEIIKLNPELSAS